jgi:hypothetical protein
MTTDCTTFFRHLKYFILNRDAVIISILYRLPIIMGRFWNAPENAGPGLLDVLKFWDRSPRFMRPQNRSLPTPFPPLSNPIRLGAEHTNFVTEFWNTYYRGADWTMNANTTWVQRLLTDPSSPTMGVFHNSRLIGTIMCRSVGNRVFIGRDTELPIAYMIEGLCVHPEWRGKHLAGWLIAWVDYIMNSNGPNAFFWCREVNTGIHTSDIAVHTYCYADCSKLTRTVPIEQMPLHEFITAWVLAAPHWRSSDNIVASRPPVSEADSDSLEVWRTNDGSNRLVVISDCHRKSLGDGKTLWEVVWCGTMTQTLSPRDPFTSFRDLLETVGSTKGPNGVLFTTDACHHGAANPGWSLPWNFGTSGFHSIHIYNYMPPQFFNCSPYFLKLEV